MFAVVTNLTQYEDFYPVTFENAIDTCKHNRNIIGVEWSYVIDIETGEVVYDWGL